MPLEMTASQASKAGSSKGYVLVVDDELDIREGLELLLSTEGYSVDLAQNAAEGVHKMETKGYDLVLLDLVAQVSPARSTVLITGDTGTGKELVAKAIHANSPRADHLFVAVNSGSLPPELLESTLFGHVKGAFTSAVHNKKGYFEVAD